MAPPSKEKKQRHDADKSHAPTAGPDYDDRGGDGVSDEEAAERAVAIQKVHDLKARILRVSVEGDRTQILIGNGRKQGVVEGMEGYIPGPGGVLADFVVTSVGERTCEAYVDLTVDMVTHAPEVLLNPSHKPQPAKHKDQHARIIGVSIQGNLTQIMIGNGRLHGAWPGEPGVILDAGGRRLAKFEIDRVDSRVSFAHVHLTVDQLHGANVILNPSDVSVEAQKGHDKGKEHAGHDAGA